MLFNLYFSKKPKNQKPKTKKPHDANYVCICFSNLFNNYFFK